MQCRTRSSIRRVQARLLPQAGSGRAFFVGVWRLVLPVASQCSAPTRDRTPPTPATGPHRVLSPIETGSPERPDSTDCSTTTVPPASRTSSASTVHWYRGWSKRFNPARKGYVEPLFRTNRMRVRPLRSSGGSCTGWRGASPSPRRKPRRLAACPPPGPRVVYNLDDSVRDPEEVTNSEPPSTARYCGRRRASSDHQRARVLADVKARRSAPLRGAHGLDAGSAHARPDWLVPTMPNPDPLHVVVDELSRTTPFRVTVDRLERSRERVGLLRRSPLEPHAFRKRGEGMTCAVQSKICSTWWGWSTNNTGFWDGPSGPYLWEPPDGRFIAVDHDAWGDPALIALSSGRAKQPSGPGIVNG